jgi:thiazole synthase ThiGH ThiG subunit
VQYLLRLDENLIAVVTITAIAMAFDETPDMAPAMPLQFAAASRAYVAGHKNPSLSRIVRFSQSS